MLTRISLKALLAVWAILLGGAAMAETGTVKGTVTYLDRMAVPPGAVLEVRLLDVSRMDVAADPLSTMRYALDRVPFAFALAYDTALIDDRMTYSVQASILVDGKARYRSTQVNPVLTRGAEDGVDIVVERMAQAEAAPSLEDTAWVVTDLGGRLIVSDKRPEIQFARDGDFSAFGSCNRFAGKAKIEGTTIRFPAAMAGTMMACPEPFNKLEQDFIAALGKVTGYLFNAQGVALVDDAGMTVLQLAEKG